MFISTNQRLGSGHLPTPVLATILVPTSTAIVCSRDDPFSIIIGVSSKHEKPVLPGGKIDLADDAGGSRIATAGNCILRELREELNIIECTPRHLFTWSDEKRDLRPVTVASLRGTLEESMIKHLPDSEILLASFGNPDYVFVVSIAHSQVKPSEELRKIFWVDARSLQETDLSAGHGHLLTLYLRSLNL